MVFCFFIQYCFFFFFCWKVLIQFFNLVIYIWLGLLFLFWKFYFWKMFVLEAEMVESPNHSLGDLLVRICHLLVIYIKSGIIQFNVFQKETNAPNPQLFVTIFLVGAYFGGTNYRNKYSFIKSTRFSDIKLKLRFTWNQANKERRIIGLFISVFHHSFDFKKIISKIDNPEGIGEYFFCRDSNAI